MPYSVFNTDICSPTAASGVSVELSQVRLLIAQSEKVKVWLRSGTFSMVTSAVITFVVLAGK